MSLLDQSEADRIVTVTQFRQLKSVVDDNLMAIRCNEGDEYKGGAGYNLDSDRYRNRVEYATALYASICFSQDTINTNLDNYRLLLLVNCSLGGGETYTYRQGHDSYETLPKSGSLSDGARVIYSWSMNDSAITLAERVIGSILSWGTRGGL